MRHFTDEERAALMTLIPTAQGLARDEPALRDWLGQLSDHERALLITWAVHYGPGWDTASIDPSDDACPS
jgi:hypothetical protein